MPAEKHSFLDNIDQNILRRLSLYESLDPLELWYELGEWDAPLERMTQQEVLNRLESLKAIGLVERIVGVGGETHWALRKG